MIRFSKLGERLARGSGIEALMRDLGEALSMGDGAMAMLGGGNPAPIPEVQALWRAGMADLLEREPERFDRMLGYYDAQQGNPRFLRAVAEFFNRNHGWDIGPENVAITNGGQTAFFFLFNLLGGPGEDGGMRKILFPLMPEYIGYAEQGLSEGMLVGAPSQIELRGETEFKYHVDFEALPWDTSVVAACVSRPTNPTGNVLTLEELRHLHTLCRERGSLLIIDNAYGTPFPNILFKDEEPFWGEGVVLTYSLSKLGLPGTRTGIVIGPPEIVAAVASMTAVAGLANGNVGQALTLPLFESDRMVSVCRDLVRPYYASRSERATRIFREAFRGLPLRIHASEGALFLWLWFPGLPIGSEELYRRFKSADVLVVPGHHFFHGLPEPWAHSQECVRINYAMDIERLQEAAFRMARVVGEL